VPRRKKRFAQDELGWALSYIERKMALEPGWPCSDKRSRKEAEEEFRRVKRKTDRDLLSDWCDRWLGATDRKRLLEALRARRKRERSMPSRKTITIDQKAWLYLSKLAKRDKVTISEYLVRKLEKDYMNMPVKGTGRRNGS